MSFFGFEQNDVFEKDKQRFQQQQGNAKDFEDLAVYTWGEENYDGLGDALVEGGDDLNDETFGGSGPVGKDFDFGSQALSQDAALAQKQPRNPTFPEATFYSSDAPSQGHHVGGFRNQSPAYASKPAVSHQAHLGWEDDSSLAVLPRVPSSGRIAPERRVPQAAFSPFDHPQALHLEPNYAQQQSALPRGHAFAGMRTAQEVEDEMRLAALQSRAAANSHILRQQSPQLAQQLHMQAPQGVPYVEQQTRTPPPRMHPHSQSPRFHQLHQQILIEQKSQQQQFRDIQQQLQLEQLARQLRDQQLEPVAQPHVSQRMLADQFPNQRVGTSPSLLEMQAAQQIQQLRGQSPAFDPHLQPIAQQPAAQYLPDNIQMQQALLARSANVEFMRDMVPNETVGRRILEAERMEEKRRRRAAKIAHMSRYNDLMTQSDKDFITRIQVSQLVTQDPYAEDFYAQVYTAILRTRMGLQSQDDRVLKFGSGGGVGLGLNQRPNGRRAGAMHKMEAQVEKIVQAARMREREKGIGALHSLQGALGKTAGRSYKAAPRQLLQVDNANGRESEGEGVAREAAKIGREHLASAGPAGLVKRDPLTRRESLAILEQLYDLVLKLEQHRRGEPLEKEGDAYEAWDNAHVDIVTRLFEGLRTSVPLDTSNPHPFISLLMPAKGKKLLPRVMRHFNEQQQLTVVTLLVACFSELDVVVHADALNTLDESADYKEVDRQTQAFMASVFQVVLQTLLNAPLRLISTLTAVLLGHNDIVALCKTGPGLAMITLFLSRGEARKHETQVQGDIEQWDSIFTHLFHLLTPHLLFFFPSVRITGSVAYDDRITASLDSPVWQFFATLALNAATPERHALLVTALREKILSDVSAATKGWIVDEKEREAKLKNVNFFLGAIGLDSSQIAL